MSSEGTQGTGGHAGERGIPLGGAVPPPRPAHAPGEQSVSAGTTFLTWLRTPRPAAAPGVWRFGHR
ncbi:hypothetical protein, partial [Streptomyces sp. SID14478]|uniref:hypothetical protein n=1 Tax=Streptomyces sp. SID14478 TaxID=2706073 RepID=UPI0013DF69E6